MEYLTGLPSWIIYFTNPIKLQNSHPFKTIVWHAGIPGGWGGPDIQLENTGGTNQPLMWARLHGRNCTNLTLLLLLQNLLLSPFSEC